MPQKIFILLCCFFLITPTFANYIQTEKKAFVRELVWRDHFNPSEVNKILHKAHKDPQIIAHMKKPLEKKPWHYYKNFFITPERVHLGVLYLRKHLHVLNKMSTKYGIPASIIVAIIGVETEYGRHLGKYSVLNALYTLGFYYPPREKFFRKELEQYLILIHNNHLNPTAIKGSYAGAFGIPQFMPSSYRTFSTSYHPYTVANLFNHNDAILSIANYFYHMGWQPKQIIVRPLSWHYAYFNSRIASRIQLEAKHGKEYWAAYPNFKVIMSYNHNIVYAMAVYQLAKQIEKQYARSYP